MEPLDKLPSHSPILRNIAKTIQSEQLIRPEDSVLAAVSGGPDSVALLHILNELRPLMFCRLGVAHLNHCIRPYEAEKEAEFVSNLCRTLNLPIYIRKTDVQSFAKERTYSLEEAGRICRYDFFKSVARSEGYTKIALGHHADDNAELILMFILRGSGPSGISGMPFIRDNLYIRPLLKLCRKEIVTFLSTNHIDYVSDCSNLDTKYTRNRIRHRLIPMLKQEFNPNVVATLNSLSTVIRSEDEWLSEISHCFFDQAQLETNSNSVVLLASELRTLHPALVRRILRKAIADLKGNLRRISLRHIDAIRTMVDRGRGYHQLNLPDKILVEFEHERLTLSISREHFTRLKGKMSQDSSFKFKYSVKKDQDWPHEIYVGQLRSCFRFSIINQNIADPMSMAGQNTAFFDMGRLMFPLIIRNALPGDRFSPLGMEGTQKLADFFINTKVPQSKRKHIPILESNGHIIWIVGYRCSHHFRIRSETNQILKVEFFLPKRQ